MKNPPAFPMQFLGDEGTDNKEEGMSLRDYFAGQAMIALALHATDYNAMANRCYNLADAMLGRRGDTASPRPAGDKANVSP